MKNFWKKTLPYVAIALVFSLFGAGITMLSSNSYAPGAKAEAAQVSTKIEGTVTSPFTQAVKAVRPSVVGVNQYGKIPTSNNYNYYYSDPFNFFGYGLPRGGNTQPEQSNEEVKLGSGSGVAISDQGHILTNYHVVEGADSLTVSVEDKEYDATLIAFDQALDIAIIQAKGLKLNPVSLGDSDALQVGEWAIAIGNPLTSLNESFTGTTTVGVVSGLNRSVTNKVTDEYGRVYESVNSTMIQVDAAINSGNSGGGLFNVLGELVGIPTIKYSGKTSADSAYIDGIGMCVAINDAKPLIEKVLSGEITAPEETEQAEENKEEDPASLENKPRLGIKVSGINQNHSLALSGQLPQGIVVAEIEKDTPAENSALKQYDIIVEANGTRITSYEDLNGVISALNAGDTITLKVFRMNESVAADDSAGEYIDVPVTLAVID